jgi:hypothetical protein
MPRRGRSPAVPADATPWRLLPRIGARWTAQRKALVLSAIQAGSVTVLEVCERYQISPDELTEWHRLDARFGEQALRVSTLQYFRGLEKAESTSRFRP